jgi:hypothetical protein
VLPRDDELLDVLLEIYNQQRGHMAEETLAAIINLFLIVEARYGRAEPSVLKDHSIAIFRDYQAESASESFSLIIENNYEQEWIIDYLLYSLRLLHFLK